MRRLVSIVLLATGCADYVHVETAADRARIEAETHIDFFEANKADKGDAVVRIVTRHGLCSGALVSDAVVVTAEHCLTELHDDGYEALAPGYVYIELGKDPLPWGRVSASHVLVCDGWDGLASHDVGAIVLDKRVPLDVPRLSIKLDADPLKDGTFVARGFGSGMATRTMPLTGSAIWSTTRVERSGALAWYNLDDFGVSLSSDHGDSGGPVLADGSNEVLGVTSLRQEDGKSAPLTVAARFAPCVSVLERAAALEVWVN